MKNNSLLNFSEKYVDDICLVIIGNNKSVFILKDKTIQTRKLSKKNVVELFNENENYIKINSDTIINTTYFIDIISKKDRTILMKTGNILKVSRKGWTYFK